MSVDSFGSRSSGFSMKSQAVIDEIQRQRAAEALAASLENEKLRSQLAALTGQQLQQPQHLESQRPQQFQPHQPHQLQPQQLHHQQQQLPGLIEIPTSNPIANPTFTSTVQSSSSLGNVSNVNNVNNKKRQLSDAEGDASGSKDQRLNDDLRPDLVEGLFGVHNQGHMR